MGFDIILLIMAGLAAGMVAGLFGLGGGIIFTPVLLLFFQASGVLDPVLWTIGTSLLCNFAAASSSSFQHYLKENLFLKESLYVGGAGILGTVIGKVFSVSPLYSEREFRIFFSLILFHSVYHFFKKKKAGTGIELDEKKIHPGMAMLIGLCAGILANLAGVGGGLIIVPALSILWLIPFRKAISISSSSIVIITLSGWLQLALMHPADTGFSGVHLGYVDLGTAAPLIIGSFFGAHFGVRLVDMLPLRLVEVIFACLILFLALRLLYGLW
ncbi:sulfite exporter TauE/SafE family protein [Balneolaceae bacterium ANBcel3]|nr:sulfite exporter TauE/SafE family protein [Balneolaceae bacterium ANBcel3]